MKPDPNITMRSALRYFRSFILFTVTGLLASWIFYHSPLLGGAQQNEIQFLPPLTGVLTGMIYTTATIILFLFHRIYADIRSLLLYYFMMSATYIVLFLLSFMTMWFVLFTGIIFCSIGVWIHFGFVSKYIFKLKYHSWILFLTGGIAFILNDVIMLLPEKERILQAACLEDDLNGSFTTVIFFWQLFTGLGLTFILERSRSSSRG